VHCSASSSGSPSASAWGAAPVGIAYSMILESVIYPYFAADPAEPGERPFWFS
jgi:hypothetical protein